MEESNYLVLNAGRLYSITIDAPEMVETFCLFFRAGFVEEVCRVETSWVESLLDEPNRVEGAEFYTDARNDKGKTPADIAEEAKHLELAARLRNLGR